MLDHVVNEGRFSDGLLIEMTVAALFSGRALSVMNFMGLGAKAVPGGNDSLVLWVIPSFTIHGIAAYAVMIGVVTLLIVAMRRFGVTM